MKKPVLSLTLGAVLVPSLWAGPPAIKVQDQQPTTSFVGWLISLFQ